MLSAEMLNQHQESLEVQCGNLKLMCHQAEQDRLFKQSLLAAIRAEAQEDWKVMADAFKENLQLMQETFKAVRESGTTSQPPETQARTTCTHTPNCNHGVILPPMLTGGKEGIPIHACTVSPVDEEEL